MKKYLLVLILLIIFVTGCEEKKYQIGEKSNIVISESVNITSINYDNNELSMIVTNNSDGIITYGETYELEIKKNGEWYKIDSKYYYNTPAYILNKNESKEIVYDLFSRYGKLNKGDYRITKDIVIDYNGVLTDSFIAGEFSIGR